MKNFIIIILFIIYFTSCDHDDDFNFLSSNVKHLNPIEMKQNNEDTSKCVKRIEVSSGNLQSCVTFDTKAFAEVTRLWLITQDMYSMATFKYLQIWHDFLTRIGLNPDIKVLSYPQFLAYLQSNMTHADWVWLQAQFTYDNDKFTMTFLAPWSYNAYWTVLAYAIAHVASIDINLDFINFNAKQNVKLGTTSKETIRYFFPMFTMSIKPNTPDPAWPDPVNITPTDTDMVDWCNYVKFVKFTPSGFPGMLNIILRLFTKADVNDYARVDLIVSSSAIVYEGYMFVPFNIKGDRLYDFKLYTLNSNGAPTKLVDHEYLVNDGYINCDNARGYVVSGGAGNKNSGFANLLNVDYPLIIKIPKQDTSAAISLAVTSVPILSAHFDDFSDYPVGAVSPNILTDYLAPVAQLINLGDLTFMPGEGPFSPIASRLELYFIGRHQDDPTEIKFNPSVYHKRFGRFIPNRCIGKPINLINSKGGYLNSINLGNFITGYTAELGLVHDVSADIEADEERIGTLIIGLPSFTQEVAPGLFNVVFVSPIMSNL